MYLVLASKVSLKAMWEGNSVPSSQCSEAEWICIVQSVAINGSDR